VLTPQRRIIKKDVDLNKAREWVRYFRSKGLPVRTSFILGFPSETRAMMDESIEYARTLGADWYDFFIATPLAGSEMCQEFVDLGYMPDDIEVISRGYYSRRNFDTPGNYFRRSRRPGLSRQPPLQFQGQHQPSVGKLDQGLGTVHAHRPQVPPFHIIAQDCIRRCYEGLGDAAGAAGALAAIENAVRDDNRAWDMAKKFGDLLSPATQQAILAAEVIRS
jgi:hypothetical protein